MRINPRRERVSPWSNIRAIARLDPVSASNHPLLLQPNLEESTGLSSAIDIVLSERVDA
jgi:hypothetical protein